MWWQTLALRDAVATDMAGTSRCKHRHKFKLIRLATAKAGNGACKTWFTNRLIQPNSRQFSCIRNHFV